MGSEIRSKRQFFSLWREGVLGNRTLLSESLDEAMTWPTDRIGFREQGRTGGGAWELAQKPDAPAVYARWRAAGRNFIMDGSVPNHRTVLQGEVTRTVQGLEGFLCERSLIQQDFALILQHCWHRGEYVPEVVETFLASSGLPPMRETMRLGLHRHTSYLQTRILLDRYMDASSRDDLDALLELYPDAAIEFSVFSVNVGVFPSRNTIFWETRNY